MASSTGNRLPIITLALAALIFAGFVWPGGGPEGAAVQAERTREEAQEFYRRHGDVTLSARDRALIGAEHVDFIDARREAPQARSRAASPRSHARIQRQFDALAEAAFSARRAARPAWRFGVEPGDRVGSDFFAYAFFHDEAMALAITLIFLVVAGIGIEGAWGSLFFVFFCASAIFIPAFAHAALATEGGVPLAGASGLLAALLAAYALRGWGGRFALPGWVILPLWLFAEYVVVRGAYFDRVEGLPLVAHGAGLALGIAAVVGVGLLGMERHQAERSGAAASSKNPALPLAARAVAEGNFDAAWSALSSAAEEDPDDDEVALAWWRLACDQGRAEEAVKVILSRIRAELRGGDLDTALGYWFDVTHHAPGAQVDARMTIRLAESLLERGERAGAREALRRAVEDTEGLSTALAQRVVRSARDLDSELARAAALVALQDAQLDPDSRTALEALIEADAPGPDAAVAVEVEVEEALPDAIELAEEVLDLDDPIESAANAEELAPQPEHEGPAALGEEALAIELAGLEGEALEENDFAQLGLAEELTDPGGSDDPDGAANASALDEAELSVAGLLDDRGTDLSDGREQWEEAQEIEPLGPPEPPPDPDPVAGGFEEREEDKAILEGGEESPLEASPSDSQTLRTAKVIEGAPIAVGAEALEVEITGRGLGRIPYSRIEAVAVAAVAGLSVRPVLVVDLVLNWNSRFDEPLKVIRIRGNQFDPLSLVPGAPSPLQALKDMIATISGRSGAESLPSEAALDGTPFHRCEDLAQFESEILGVEG